MANYGIKVETVLGKFYDVRQDETIKGLYEVRKKENPEEDIMWYFFSSNNATYHSSGNDCVGSFLGCKDGHLDSIASIKPAAQERMVSSDAFSSSSSLPLLHPAT